MFKANPCSGFLALVCFLERAAAERVYGKKMGLQTAIRTSFFRTLTAALRKHATQAGFQFPSGRGATCCCGAGHNFV